jgi:cyclohexyl-isocyanide hydratase
MKEKRLIIEGNIATAAGISAGIDLALHFIKLLYSEEHAIKTSKYIQYDPEPPFEFNLEAEVMFSKKPY